jgi:DNA (cytosine-5)-methyltransferase 1
MNLATSCVDLFCGIGGLTNGLIQAGINVKAGFDFDASCKFAYETNNKAEFVHSDLRNTPSDTIKSFFTPATTKVLVGCAPCQPFSSYAHSSKSRFSDDKWSLIEYFGKYIEEIEPEIVSMENVPQIRNHKIFKEFTAILDRLNYECSVKIVNSVEYGIPQKRKRLVLLASKLGPIRLIEGTKGEQLSLKEVISDLNELNAGEVDPADPLHRSPALTDINMKRVKSSRPGGTWLDWDEELRLECHKKDSGASYKSVYGRLDANQPAVTMTTQFFNIGTGRFIHPTQDRALSLREASLIQTFPKDYQIINPEIPFSFKKYGTHIGNAVPVRLGEIIGISIQQHLEKIYGI